MPTVPLCCDNIGELNGTLARAIIDAALGEAVRDLEDRAEYDGKDRKVVIEIKLKLLDNGQIATTVAAQSKLPPRHTSMTVANLRRKGDKHELMFSPNCPEQPDQRTIMDHTGDDA